MILSSLFASAAILCAAAGYGWVVLRALRREVGRDALQLLSAVGLGLGTIAHLVLIVGLSGALTRPVLGALLLGGLPGLVVLFRTWTGGRREPRKEASGLLYGRLLSVYLVVLAALTACGALAPVGGLDWDGLSYHLAAPRIYLAESRIPFIAYDSHTHFPFVMEMLYTVGLAFGDAAGAKLLHWSAGWMTAGAAGIWAARLAAGAGLQQAWVGPLAAAIYASAPIVLWEMGTAYVDLGTAFFQLMALIALSRAIPLGSRGAPFRIADAAVAGVLTGWALGTKMTALVQLAILGVLLLGAVLLSLRESRRSGWLAGVAFTLLALACGSPWYLKSWLWTGNPVYPFFYNLFPGSYSWTQAAAAAYAAEQQSFGMGRGLGEFLGAPWNLAVHGREFFITLRTLTGDKLASIGALPAGLLPLLFWARGLPPVFHLLGLYLALSFLAWFSLSHQARYLMPQLAVVGPLLAVGLAAIPGRLLQSAGGVFAAISLLLSLQMHVPFAAPAMRTLGDERAAREYLRIGLGGLYEASEFINTLPESVRVALYQETRGFYIRRRYFWANPAQHNLIPYDSLRDGAGLARELRRFGITHVLINYDFSRDQQEADWYRLLMHAIGSGVLSEVFRSEGARHGARGVIVYRLT